MWDTKLRLKGKRSCPFSNGISSYHGTQAKYCDSTEHRLTVLKVEVEG